MYSAPNYNNISERGVIGIKKIVCVVFILSVLFLCHFCSVFASSSDLVSQGTYSSSVESVSSDTNTQSSFSDISSPSSTENYTSLDRTLEIFWFICLNVIAFIGGLVLSVLATLKLGVLLYCYIPFTIKLADIVKKSIYRNFFISIFIWFILIFGTTIPIALFSDYYIAWFVGVASGVIPCVRRCGRTVRNFNLYIEDYKKYIDFSRRIEILVIFNNEFEKKQKKAKK